VAKALLTPRAVDFPRWYQMVKDGTGVAEAARKLTAAG
jgi:hypothetical protein